MNAAIFNLYMKHEPASPSQKYMFLVDSKRLAECIVMAGFPSTAILSYDTGGECFTLASFLSFMGSIELKGSCRMDYCYVLCCSLKSYNDEIAAYLTGESLSIRQGWRLFKGKEYLEKIEHLDQLEKLLKEYVDGLEGPPTEKGLLDLTRFHHVNDKGVITGVFDAEIVSYLIECVPMMILNRMPFIYENGVFREDVCGLRLQAKIQALIFKEFVKSSTIRRVYDLLVIQPSLQCTYAQLNDHPAHWINFKNGFFDVIEWKMLPHDPKYHSINQIPYNFDPEAGEAHKGKKTQAFLNQMLPGAEDQKTFWQYLGYCMTTDTSFQKFMMIKGPGSTGKSVLVDLTEEVVGFDNTVSVSIQDLNKRFYATGLFGKLLNACADIPSTALQSIDVLKKAVGEDSVLYERKGQDPTKFKSYAKLLFSANEMPLNLDDKTNAYYRRLLVLEMNNIIPVHQRDRHLREKLKQEMDFIIMTAMKALQSLYKEGAFTVSERSEECIEDLYRSADSVKAFLDEAVENMVGKKINRSKMYSEYYDYCKENDRQAHGKASFFRMMQDKGYMLKHLSDGYFYMDVAFKEPGFLPVDPEEKVPFEQMKLDLND